MTLLIEHLHGLRRRVTAGAMHGALALGGGLTPRSALALGRLAGGLAALPHPMRWRLARHWRCAGIEPAAARLDRYFRHLGDWFGQSMAVYRHGFAASGVGEQIELEGEQHLTAALSLGRGALLADFHYHSHELACGAIARRFPLVGLVRESKSAAHREIKRCWYAALGIETVARSRGHGVKLAAALDFLWVLRENKVLAVAPDVLGPRGQGIAVEFFGREVELPAGLIALAMGTGAPVVFAWPARRDGRLVVRFDEPLTFAKRGDRQATLRDGLQLWARRLEALLRREPECWMQWLDKQWSRVWRGER